ncbi:MAG: Arm DNA-binding domain-containing protein [Rhodanobacteraceae bacterium]
MSSVRARLDGRLFFDFRYQGERCRELSTLRDTPANQRKMERVLARIDNEIAAGTFQYARAFPHSKKAAHFSAPAAPHALAVSQVAQPAPSEPLPTFAEFARIWQLDKQVEWRVSYRTLIESTLATHLLPEFGAMHLDEIDRAAVMAFRSDLAAGKHGRQARLLGTPPRALAPATVNRTVGIVRMIMDEAAQRFGISNPCLGIKRLKLQRPDITPFTLEEMQAILAGVRRDYRPYLTFRFLTGVRSGEAHGLKWKHVDFERRLALIRETFQDGRTEYTKTDGSQRDIHLSQPVVEALLTMRPAGYAENAGAFADTYVFHTRRGKPIDNSNFNDRVWKPLLRRLGIAYRRPYDMRHTCATLWLAAGEAPEWIARQLGHTTTEMLFRTYSRFVPNLLHHDGRAFDNVVSGIVNRGVSTGRTRPPGAPIHSTAQPPTGGTR